MKDVCLFVPEPGNMKATLAVSAIARAMHQMNKVAIVRCVWRQGQGNVALGVLTPNISSVNNVVSIIYMLFTFEIFDEAQSILYYMLQQDSFYFSVLPFAEDIREFQFRSFSSLPSSSQPTEEQQEAADNLVKMLDLAPPGREVLKPEFTPNPMLEVLFFMVEHHVEAYIRGPICYLIFIYSLYYINVPLIQYWLSVMASGAGPGAHIVLYRVNSTTGTVPDRLD